MSGKTNLAMEHAPFMKMYFLLGKIKISIDFYCHISFYWKVFHAFIEPHEFPPPPSNLWKIMPPSHTKGRLKVHIAQHPRLDNGFNVDKNSHLPVGPLPAFFLGSVKNNHKQKLVGGWPNPSWKILISQHGFIFPNFRGENKIFFWVATT